MKKYHCIIIGSGIAAMQLANQLRKQVRVLIITKSNKQASNSYRAQGGVAAALSEDDDPALHYEDTIKAGCFFHDEMEVWELVHQAPDIIKDLKHRGVRFNENNAGELSLGMEGAHSRKRIVHCGGDATGKHMMDFFHANVGSNVDIIEDQFVYELMIHLETNSCVGIKTKDERGRNHTYVANHVVLAAGGVGGLYSFTSNDPSITGDGIALAYHAGAEIIDMEFIQFHPTLLYVKGETKGLISEAVRGAGGRLVDEFGQPLMAGRHPLADLAPRHIVAKEIFEARGAGREVYLDITRIRHFERKFPTITALCEENGILVGDGKLPVAPGCHFLMGGVLVNSVGETSVKGLYAIGETAATGVHGANRLASNSLLEGLVYGRKLAKHLNELPYKNEVDIPVFSSDQQFVKTRQNELQEKELIRKKMMRYAGIIRTHSELNGLQAWLKHRNRMNLLEESFDQCNKEEIQLCFMLQVAKLITDAALAREESRGAHIREDFPNESEQWKEIHIVHSKNGMEMRRKNERYQVEIHA